MVCTLRCMSATSPIWNLSLISVQSFMADYACKNPFAICGSITLSVSEMTNNAINGPPFILDVQCSCHGSIPNDMVVFLLPTSCWGLVFLNYHWDVDNRGFDCWWWLHFVFLLLDLMCCLTSFERVIMWMNDNQIKFTCFMQKSGSDIMRNICAEYMVVDWKIDRMGFNIKG